MRSIKKESENKNLYLASSVHGKYTCDGHNLCYLGVLSTKNILQLSFSLEIASDDERHLVQGYTLSGVAQTQ